MLTGHTSAVTAAVYSPDGKRLASGTGEGRIKLWSTETGEGASELARAHGPGGQPWPFPGMGNYWPQRGEDGNIHIWDVQQGKLRDFNLKPGGRIAGIAFHPDRRTLAVNSQRKGRWTVTLWDARPLRLRRTLVGVDEFARAA